MSIEEKHWFNNRQVMAIIFSVVVATFYVTLVYAEFQNRSTEYKADKEILLQKIQVLEDRLDKKIKIINDNTENINQLKLKLE